MSIKAPLPQTEPVAPPVEEPETAPEPVEPTEPKPEPDPFQPDWPKERPLPPPKAGTVDLGPYENQSPALLALFMWFQSNGISTHASSLYADLDHDGMNNVQEWIAGTDLTNATSNFRLQSLSLSNSPARAKLTWTSVTNRAYFIERSTNLNSRSFSIIKTNIAGLLQTTSFTDSNPPPTARAFYRVGVQQ